MPRSCFNLTAAALSCAALAAGCSGTTSTQLTGPTDTVCSVSANAPLQPLAADGGRVTVNAAASRDCVWTASSQSPWLQVSPARGQGDGTVTIIAAANASGEVRIGAVLINDVHLTVTQGVPPAPAAQPGGPVAEPSPNPAPAQGPAPAPVPAPSPAPTPPSSCSVSVTPRSARFDSDGGDGAITVSSAPGCTWTANASNNWIDITSGERGTGSGVVRYEVDSHKGKGGRNGTIAVGGTTVTITQSGKD